MYLRFIFPDKKQTIITWYIAPYLARIISAAIGWGLAVIVWYFCIHQPKLKKEREKQNSLKGIKARSGVDLEKVIEPDKVYKITNKKLEKKIREITGQKSGPLIGEHKVAIFAWMLVKKPLSRAFQELFRPFFQELVVAQIIMQYQGYLNSEILVPFLASFVVGIGSFGWLSYIGLFTGSSLATITLSLAATGFSCGLLGYGGQVAYNRLIANSPAAIERVMKPLKQVETSDSSNSMESTPTHTAELSKKFFIDEDLNLLDPKNSNVYIRSLEGEKTILPKRILGGSLRGSMDTEIKINTKHEISVPAEKIKSSICKDKVIIKNDKQLSHVERTCDESIQKYVPLSQRTTTLKDIIHENDTKNLKEFEELEKTFDERTNAYRKRRERIMSQRKMDQTIDNILNEFEF